jgi:hypothetical protein
MSEIIKNREEKMRSKQFKKYALVGGSVMLLSIACTEPAFAAFDLDKGVKAATDPLVALITKYYGVGIGVGAIGGAFVAQGDYRTKFQSAGMGAAIAGGVCLGLLKAFT